MQQEDYSNNQRRVFADILYEEMAHDKKIYLIVCDLGWHVFDNIRDDYPERFLNTGAAEQCASDIACGLAVAGMKPFLYSITTFLIRRAFETLDISINHESIPVRLVGSGRNNDYLHDGYSHDASDTLSIMNVLGNITQYWPGNVEAVKEMTHDMITKDEPSFISLTR